MGPDGLFHVSSTNYHAWVEVPFPGYGWLAFEPTPTRTNPVAVQYQREPSTTVAEPGCVVGGVCEDVAPRGGPIPGRTSGVAEGGAPVDRLRSLNGDTDSFTTGPPPDVGAPPEEAGFPLGTVVVLVLVALAVLAVSVPLTKKVVRRVRVRRASEPREVVLAAYRLFEGEAADAGLGRRPGETLWEHRIRLRTRVRFSDGHLDRLTGITGRAAYSTRTVSDDLAREAVGAAGVAARDVRRSVSVGRRVAGWYRIGPRR
jgi:hypothetical protein